MCQDHHVGKEQGGLMVATHGNAESMERSPLLISLQCIEGMINVTSDDRHQEKSLVVVLMTMSMMMGEIGSVVVLERMAG